MEKRRIRERIARFGQSKAATIIFECLRIRSIRSTTVFGYVEGERVLTRIPHSLKG